jgi:hypothetical protein
MGKGAEARRAEAERRQRAKEEDDVACCSQEDRRSPKSEMGEGESRSEEVGVERAWFTMGKFSPMTRKGDCEEIANPSTAYGRRDRNWIDTHGSVPARQVVDASCGNQRCIALQHAYLRPRIEQPGKYRKIAERVHRLKVGQDFDCSARRHGRAEPQPIPLSLVRRLRGWTGSRCAGCRMGACASRRVGNGRACDIGYGAGLQMSLTEIYADCAWI